MVAARKPLWEKFPKRGQLRLTPVFLDQGLFSMFLAMAGVGWPIEVVALGVDTWIFLWVLVDLVWMKPHVGDGGQFLSQSLQQRQL